MAAVISTVAPLRSPIRAVPQWEVDLLEPCFYILPVQRPPELFDREWEWEALARFAGDPRPEATLGIVSGRRRQGKSLLLQLLCEQADGVYYGAIEAAEADARGD